MKHGSIRWLTLVLASSIIQTGVVSTAWSQLGTLEIATENFMANGSGNDRSFYQESLSISDEGKLVAFESEGTDLVTPFKDNNESDRDVYVRDLVTGTTTLISSSIVGGSESGNAGSTAPFISGDGSCVVFESIATDLMAGLTDSAFTTDIFIRHLSGPDIGLTELVTADTGGDPNNDMSFFTEIDAVSTDCRYVLFTSEIDDLVAVDTNEEEDVFLRDLLLGTTTLISVNSIDSNTGNDFSSGATMTPDAKLVIFSSSATDLVSGSNIVFTEQLYLRDLSGVTPTTTLLSKSAITVGNSVNGFAAGKTHITPDGACVLTNSTATDMVNPAIVLDDPNDAQLYLIRLNDIANDGDNTIELLSHKLGMPDVASNGDNREPERPGITDDCAYVLIKSDATDLVSNPDTNDSDDIFLRDIAAQTTILLSHTESGEAGNGESDDPVLAKNGSFAVFETEATDLLSAITDNNNAPDVFFVDLTGDILSVPPQLTLLSRSIDVPNTTGDDESDSVGVSANSSTIAFESEANDLVVNDQDNQPSADNKDILFARLLDTESSTCHVIKSASSKTIVFCL